MRSVPMCAKRAVEVVMCVVVQVLHIIDRAVQVFAEVHLRAVHQEALLQGPLLLVEEHLAVLVVKFL